MRLLLLSTFFLASTFSLQANWPSTDEATCKEWAEQRANDAVNKIFMQDDPSFPWKIGAKIDHLQLDNEEITQLIARLIIDGPICAKQGEWVHAESGISIQPKNSTLSTHPFPHFDDFTLLTWSEKNFSGVDPLAYIGISIWCWILENPNALKPEWGITPLPLPGTEELWGEDEDEDRDWADGEEWDFDNEQEIDELANAFDLNALTGIDFYSLANHPFIKKLLNQPALIEAYFSTIYAAIAENNGNEVKCLSIDWTVDETGCLDSITLLGESEALFPNWTSEVESQRLRQLRDLVCFTRNTLSWYQGYQDTDEEEERTYNNRFQFNEWNDPLPEEEVEWIQIMLFYLGAFYPLISPVWMA